MAVTVGDGTDERSVKLHLKSLQQLGKGRFRFCGFGQVLDPPAPNRLPIIRAGFQAIESGKFHILELSLLELPALVIGSIWNGDELESNPVARTIVRIDFGAHDEKMPLGYRPVARAELDSKVFPIPFKWHAPLVELFDLNGKRIIFPVTEILRAFYWFNNRTIRSVIGGLYTYGSLSNARFEAWREGGRTEWLDRAVRVAQIHRGSNTDGSLAKQIARFRFSAKRQIALHTLHRRFFAEFADIQPAAQKSLKRLDLPDILPPVFGRVTFNAATIALPDGRRVIQYIDSVNAPLPFADLFIAADNSNDGTTERPETDLGAAWQLPQDSPHLDDDDDLEVDTDARNPKSRPMRVRAFATKDIVAREFVAKTAPPKEASTRKQSSFDGQDYSTGHGSLGEAGGDSDSPEIKFEPADEPEDAATCVSLLVTQEAFRRAPESMRRFRPLARFRARQLPQDGLLTLSFPRLPTESYSIWVPASSSSGNSNGSVDMHTHSTSRQFGPSRILCWPLQERTSRNCRCPDYWNWPQRAFMQYEADRHGTR